MSRARPCLDLGLPLDHVTLMDCYWKDHPQATKTIELIEWLKSLCTMKDKPVNIYGVTGASGSGKDTFVNGSDTGYRHIRFGDVMKDMAYEFGMVPYDREYYEENRSARFDILPCGRTPLAAWISLDVIRTYNPFIFVEHSLERLIKEELLIEVGDRFRTHPIVFSGMRTELGLSVVRELAGTMFRVERDGHKPPKEAVLDELQVLYPVDEVIKNEGTESDLKYKGSWFLQ